MTLINVFMKPMLLMLALVCAGGAARGQVKIIGRVADSEKNYLPSVTMILHTEDSAMVKGVATDTAGNFVFERIVPGHYMISASMIGYTKYFVNNITVANQDVAVADIILQGAVTALDEVVVTEQKQHFDQKIDRLVINLEGSVTTSGNTILEVLQKSPGIILNRQDNSIKMNGKSGVQVMINNKVIQLPPDALIPLLDGMNASNVEKIELITAPPSEYGAEGNGGIIHIVTKSNDEYGTNASFSILGGMKWAETFGLNFNVHHRRKRSAYFIDYSILRTHNRHIAEVRRQYAVDEFTKTVTDYSPRENLTTQQNLSAGVEWQLTKKTLLNVLVTGYRRNWDMSAHNIDRNHASIDSTIITGMDIHESNIWQSAAGSIGVQSKINSKSDISFSMDYLFYNNDNPSTYANNVFFEQQNSHSLSKIDLTKKTPIHIFVAKADYEHRTSALFTWGAGIKSVTSSLDNNVQVARLENDVWTPDPTFTSHSTLHERIDAGYVSTRWNLGGQVQVQTGIRYEYTHTSIGPPAEKNLIERKYGYWFPNISIKKKLGMEKDLEFSYTRRITRPTYADIAPYVFFWGPNTFSSGNTSLYPALADAMTAGYHVRQWTISAQYSYVQNEITTYQPEVDSENNLIYRAQNLKQLNTWGLTITNSFSVTHWWEIQNAVTAQYQRGRTSYLPQNVSVNLFGLNVNVVNQFKLPKDFSVEISGIYQSESLSGVTLFLPSGSLNAGVQKNFGQKGILRLAMDDILGTNFWRLKTNSMENNLNSYFKYDWHNRFIRLTYTRNLGNTKLRTVKSTSGSEDERNRVGN